MCRKHRLSHAGLLLALLPLVLPSTASAQGTLADYAWNPAAYEPDASWDKWQPLLAALVP